jgi:hypothetical protein
MTNISILNSPEPPVATTITWNPVRHITESRGTISGKHGAKWIECFGYCRVNDAGGGVQYWIEPRKSAKKFAGYSVRWCDRRDGYAFARREFEIGAGFISIDAGKAFAEQHLAELLRGAA